MAVIGHHTCDLEKVENCRTIFVPQIYIYHNFRCDTTCLKGCFTFNLILNCFRSGIRCFNHFILQMSVMSESSLLKPFQRKKFSLVTQFNFYVLQ